MKKILVSMFLLVFGLCLTGCDISDNTEKPSIDMLYSDWYNCAKLPSMEDPFAEVYDGCYSIEIDENNNVTFKSIHQEQLNGTLEYEEKEYTFDIKITFENNEIANGSLSISNDSPYLRFFYKGVNHCFSKSEALSKEEFELYRSEFNAFLRDSFNNNTYPSIEEVETNELYRQYTNFNQIDPCCNGPKIYVGANKVSVISDLEKGEITATYNDGTIDNINIYDIENIVFVKLDRTFERLEQVQEGQCFLTDNHSLFYFEHSHNFINNECECGVDVYEYIKDTFINEFGIEKTRDEIELLYYFGEYNGCQVALIKGDYNIIMDRVVEIEDIIFYYKLERISVCVNNRYYLLEEAYNLSLITYDNILEIYNLYKENIN
mgnify:FL=1